MKLNELTIKIFADGAEKSWLFRNNADPSIQGFTTNPTLMRKAGISDYRAFAKEVLQEIKVKPISFEVCSDSFESMEKEALEIASWGDNVYVKIPVTNTQSQSSSTLIQRLASQQVKMNITAIMTQKQMLDVTESLDPSIPSFVSIFAGRIADTGQDPVPLMINTLKHLRATHPHAQLIWSSPREILNIFQAEKIGCHVITLTQEILSKLIFIGYDLEQFSLDTVRMFYTDALNAGYTLK